jgi:alpha-L-fucosidase 2
MWDRLFAAFQQSKKYQPLLLLALLSAQPVAFAVETTAPALKITFDKPAADWEREGLPIGNGALGAVVMGGVDVDHLQFNEKTLWTGGPGSKQGYDFGIPTESQTAKLAAVRNTLVDKGEMEPDAVRPQNDWLWRLPKFW